MDRLAPMMLTPVPMTSGQVGNDVELEALRQQLRQTQNELEDERKKTDWLYQASCHQLRQHKYLTVNNQMQVQG